MLKDVVKKSAFDHSPVRKRSFSVNQKDVFSDNIERTELSHDRFGEFDLFSVEVKFFVFVQRKHRTSDRSIRLAAERVHEKCFIIHNVDQNILALSGVGDDFAGVIVGKAVSGSSNQTAER